MTVGTRERLFYALEALPNATAQQTKIRDGWLKR
jgi:hypothetical protein